LPQAVKKTRAGLFGEIALLIFLIAFVSLAATAWSLGNAPTSEGGRILQRVMLLGPTIFPLVFVALGGRSLRNIALWKAQRGSTIDVGQE
jgi:hypothetical protein